MGKCPYCETVILSVNIERVNICDNLSPVWRGVSYVCPNLQCCKILWVSIDPITIKTDTVDELFKRFKK